MDVALPASDGARRPAAPSADGNDQYRALVEYVADAVLVVCARGIILYANPAAGTLFGQSHADLIGQHFGTPVVAGAAAEVDLPPVGGLARIAEMRAANIVWHGRPAHLASLRDVTDRKRAEAALAEASQRKDEFLAMLAHELRNPLAPVRTAIHVLRAGVGAEARVALDMMDRQIQHMTRLLDDLLEVSRVTHGSIRLQKEHIDATEVIARAVETAGPHIDARRHNLTVECEPGPHLLHGDLARLVQVVSNLLINAAKYTPDSGRIELSLRRDGTDVAIRVRDNGVGIQPELLPVLFETFSQGVRTLARSEGGLGLGLSLVRSLTELHGGTVRGHSDGPGRGAEFVVRLPLAQSESESASVGLSEKQVPSSPRTHLPSHTPKRVLVVDDNRDAADTLVLLLSLQGHSVEAAYDGPAGVAAARRFRPDLILLDLGLPGLDGYAVATALRADPETASVRIVAVSGYGQDEDRRRSLAAGLDDHLVKPVDPTVLARYLNG